MPQPPAIVTSDLHLEPHVWKDHPGLAGDAYYGLEQIVDYATNYQVKAVAALGDVFNVKYPDPYTVGVAYAQIEKLKRAGIKVVFVEGQHELSRNKPWLGIHPWPIHIHKLCMEFTPELIGYGLNWTPAGKIQKELAEIPACVNLLLCHQVWGDFHGSKIEHECDFSDVPGHVKTLITGDYHRHFTLHARNAAGSMLVGSPGSVCLQSISEDPAKACFLLRDDGDLRTLPLRTRNVFRYTIGNVEELELLLREVVKCCTPQTGVPENIAKNIVQVTYLADIPEAHERLKAAFKNDVHLFLSAIRANATEVLVDRQARQDMAAAGLAGALRVLATDDELLRDALRLENSLDPNSEWATMQSEFLLDYEQKSV